MPKLFIFDVETTGLDPKLHAIIELGYIVVDDFLRELDCDSCFVHPFSGAHIEKGAMDTHGINILSDQFQSTAAPEEFVVNQLNTVRDKHTQNGDKLLLAGWNVDFDISFLKALYARQGQRWPFDYHTFDVQAVNLFFTGFKPEHLVAKHRALDDARQTLDTLRKWKELMNVNL